MFTTKLARGPRAAASVLLALLIGGSSLPGGGLGGPASAEARQSTQDTVKSAPGGGQLRGVAMRPEPADSQAPPARRFDAPPVGMTDRGEAALERARRGEALPAERPTIDIGAFPAGSTEPAAEAPAFGGSFLGMSDTGWFPPDGQIAAGPNNVVVATNGGVNIFDKNGNTLSSQTLGGFYSALGTEHSGAFDPWLVYDPYINRFWLVAVSRDTATLRSDIVIALSATSDATLGWWLWELDATVNGATDTNNWCDYEKLGFEANQIYVTCNMFLFGGGFQYSKIRTMSKTQFVNNTAIFWWDFWDLREGNSGSTTAFTMQPAVMYGAGTDGGFLINARGGGGTGSILDVWRITNAAECCDGDATGPTLTYQSVGVGGYGPSDGARQPGTTTQIHNGDSRLLYAFWKNGRLSTGHTVTCGSPANNACVGYTELNVASFPTTPTVVNNWSLTAGGQDVYYPAASVNAADDRTLVFTVSDGSLAPTAAYVGVPSSADCTTCLDGSTTAFRFGTSQPSGYIRLDTSSRNRWGDYSGASPDPNGVGIWVAGQFTAATDNTWGIQAALTYQSQPPPANDNFARAQLLSGTNIAVNGRNTFATREPPEPDHWPGGSVGESTAWYRWTAPVSGAVRIDTCDSSFDTVLTVYVGSTLGGLSQVLTDDDSCDSPNASGSVLTFSATAGTTYQIVVAGYFASSQGTFVLRLLDVQPPRVRRVVPVVNATGVAPGVNVRAFFNEAMSPASIGNTTFRLFEASTNTRVAAVVTYDPATRAATLNPNVNLRRGVRYKAVVTAVRDLAGNRLDQKPSVTGNQNMVWFFTITP